MNIKDYMQDGADMQARCVLCYLQVNAPGVEENIDATEVGRFENCREQGYCVSVAKKGKQLNIIFFEHRNGDNLCAVEWIEKPGLINTPTLDAPGLKKSPWYNDKFAVSKEVPYMHIQEMGDWIVDELNNFLKDKKLVTK